MGQDSENCCSSGCCPQPYYCNKPATCFPSVCEVTKIHGCTTAPNAAAPTYGRGNPPPCGLGAGGSCGPCCWDSTLCFPIPEECSPGDNVVHIQKPSQAPQISADAAAALAIYNYSLQNVISRGLKFVASYYDWLYCQIGLYKWRNDKPPAASGDDASDPSETSAYLPSVREKVPPQFYSSKTEISEDASGETLKTDTYNEGGHPQQFGGVYTRSSDPDQVALGINAGNAYTPPANLFAQVAQVLGWADTTFSQVDLASCVCNNLCQFIQMLINIEGKSTIRDFIKDQTFNSAQHQFSPQYLGCGNLYDEGKLVDFGDSVISVIDLLMEVLNSLGVDEDPEQGEQLMQKLCLCLAKAAGRGTCNVGGCNLSFSNNPIACDNACPDLSKFINDVVIGVDFADGPIDGANHDPSVIGYNNNIYRQQFFTMFVDLLQFVLFDRDCNPDSFKKSGDCGSCCPAPPSQEDWLKSRCRAGTGDGKCVVCTGACADYRRKDDYKPLVSSLLAVKHAITLISLDRSDVQNQATYSEQVATVYNNIVTDYYNLYKDHGDTLTFYPDCAAPQFCCSTQLAADKCQFNCCTGVCENVAGCCLYPVPVIDTRKATWCCGQGVQYTPSLGGCFDSLCVDLDANVQSSTEDGTDSISIFDTTSKGSVQWDCFSNPCVIMPWCAQIEDCNQDCCDQDPCHNHHLA